jgi:hypothetical protein
MGGWHIYCLLSGMSAERIRGFIARPTIKGLASGLSRKLSNAQNSDALPPQDETEAIPFDALTRLSERNIPDSMNSWCNEVAFVTDFEGGDNSITEITEDTSYMDPIYYVGRRTFREKLRFCTHYAAGDIGWEKYLSNDTTWIWGSTDMSGLGPGDTLFVDRKCWYYLNSWLSIPAHSDISDDRGLEWDILHVVRDSLRSSTEPQCINPGLNYGPVIQGYWRESFLHIIIIMMNSFNFSPIS